jgi:hypothetical protein
VRLSKTLAVVLALLVVPVAAHADEADPPVTQARDMLTRAKQLDEVAKTAEREVITLEQRLPGLRTSAEAARKRAKNGEQALVAEAENLEADLIVSEAEVASKRKASIEARETAHTLRSHAVRLVIVAPPAKSDFDYEAVLQVTRPRPRRPHRDLMSPSEIF